MPQAATPNMGLIKPTENGDSGVWASLLDAMFDQLDAHDHTTGKGVKVPMATGVTIAADIPWNSGGSFFAITGLKAVDFQPQPAASMASYLGALFVDSADNELKYRTTGGAVITFTSGSTFAFSTIGAIGGDYSAVGALVDYVDANGLYRLRQEVAGGSQQFAIAQTGGVDLFEFKLHPTVGVPTQRVRLASPAALVSSYQVTWPGALPGSTLALQSDNTGQISFSNTFASLVTANAGITVGANQNITTSGTGDFKHGTRTLSIHGSVFQPIGSNSGATTNPNPGYNNSIGLTGVGAIGTPSPPAFPLNVCAPIPLRIGDRILAVRCYISDSATGPTKLSCSIFSANGSTGAAVNAGSAGPSAGTGAQQTLTISGLTLTVSSALSYFVNVTTSSGTNQAFVTMMEVDYDHP